MSAEKLLDEIYNKLMSATSDDMTLLYGGSENYGTPMEVHLFGVAFGRMYTSSSGDTCFFIHDNVFHKLRLIGEDRLSAVTQHIGGLVMRLSYVEKINSDYRHLVAEQLADYFNVTV